METDFLLYVIGTGQPIDLPLVIFYHMLSALDGTKTTSLSYGILISSILFSKGVAVGPQDSIVRRRGSITYRTVSLSASHVQSDDSDAENEDQGAAAAKAPPQFDPQMPAYFQDFENHLYDQSTQIEMLENRVDSQFTEVFA